MHHFRTLWHENDSFRNCSYFVLDALNVELLGKGFMWLDTSKNESLVDTINFVKTNMAVSESCVGRKIYERTSLKGKEYGTTVN